MTTTLRAFITGLLLGAFSVNSIGAVLPYTAGTTIKFAPDSTIAGINVGSLAGDPSAPLNGDLWYDSTANELTARINGANVALGSGSSAGLISITNDSGTTSSYNPASDTDAARGTALLTAVAAASAGQTVRVGAGTFALSTSRLLIPDDVSLDLDPATLITGTANLSVEGPMVRPGNRSVVRGGKIQGVAASGVSQAPFGISSFVASPDPQTVDFVLDGVTLEADSDAFYILSNEACSGIIRNCDLISKYDIIYVSGYSGDPASHAVQIYNTRGVVVGPSSIAFPVARGTIIAYGATVDIHGGSLSVSDGGVTLNAGVAVYQDGILNLYGVPITASNGVNPNYDLYTNGTGIINVNGGVGSDTDGVFIVSGGANVNYISGSVAASGSSLTATYIGYGSGANAVTGEAAFAYDSTLNILSVDAIKLFATGVGISAASSGVLKLEGLGSGFDEAINMDFDTTSNVVRTSSPSTGVTIMDYLDMSLRVTDGGGNFATLGPSGITVHNSAWAGNYTLDFGGTDGDAETIASQEWVTANTTAAAKRVITTTDDATAVIDVTATDIYQLSAVANATTFSTTGTPVDGQQIMIRIKDAGTAKGLTWDAAFVAIGVTLPTTTTAGKWTYVGAAYNSAAAKFHVLAVTTES